MPKSAIINQYKSGNTTVRVHNDFIKTDSKDIEHILSTYINTAVLSLQTACVKNEKCKAM